MLSRKDRRYEDLKASHDDLVGRLDKLERQLSQEREWTSWNRNASNTGGQFGFGYSSVYRDHDVQA